MDNQNPTQVPPVNPTPSIDNPITQPADNNHVYVAPHIENPPPKKFSLSPKIMLLILAILIVAVVGSGIYLAQESKTAKCGGFGGLQCPAGYTCRLNNDKVADAFGECVKGVENTLASSKPTPTPDPTATWKTYNSKQLGFEIKYPPNWKAKDPSEDNQYKGLASQLWLTDSVFPMPETDSVSPVSITKFKTEDCSVNPNGWNNYKTEPYILGEKTATKTTAIHAEFNRPLYVINLLDRGNCYTANLSYTQEEYIKIFEQILSTFKFTDSSQNVKIRCGSAVGQCPSGYTCEPNPDITGPVGDAPGACIKNTPTS